MLPYSRGEVAAALEAGLQLNLVLGFESDELRDAVMRYLTAAHTLRVAEQALHQLTGLRLCRCRPPDDMHEAPCKLCVSK